MPALPPSMHVIERDWLSCNQVLFFDGEGGGKFATAEALADAVSARWPDVPRRGRRPVRSDARALR
mgnify:CR=1 FL=1